MTPRDILPPGAPDTTGRKAWEPPMNTENSKEPGGWAGQATRRGWSRMARAIKASLGP